MTQPSNDGADDSQPPENKDAGTGSSIEMSSLTEEQQSHLKGLGIEDLSSPESLGKILDGAISAKKASSESGNLANEIKGSQSEIMQALTSMRDLYGPKTEETTPTPPPEVKEATPANPATPPVDNAGQPSVNEAIAAVGPYLTMYPELKEGFLDGSHFKEVRALGGDPLDIQKTVPYLEKLKELHVLKEQAKESSKPNPDDSPPANPDPNSGSDQGVTDVAKAQQVILQGSRGQIATDSPEYKAAQAVLRASNPFKK